MLNGENSQLKPNLLGQTVEEQEEERKKEQALFRDRTNRMRNQRRMRQLDKYNPKEESCEVAVLNNELCNKEEEKKQVKGGKTKKDKENIFLQFGTDSEDQKSDGREQNIDEKYLNEQEEERNTVRESLTKMDKNFLIALSSEEQEQLEEAVEENKGPVSGDASTEVNTPNQPESSLQDALNEKMGEGKEKEFLFDLSFQNQKEQPEQQPVRSQSEEYSSSYQSQDSQQRHNRPKSVLSLSSLINDYKDQYYLQPIPEGKTFQCVMKRQRTQSYLRYHMYDSQTLRNFMTVLKIDDYMVVSKYQSISCRNLQDNDRKEKVVGRISSNFFGTEFSCSLQNAPFKMNGHYPVPSKKQRIMSIQFQTNLFGLKGPRVMSAYIGKGFYYRKLNEVYEEQKEHNLKKTVGKYKNKVPKWCNDTGSYVLNFYGRASVSSIKNFIIIGADQKDSALPKVLFGKFGKQLFNLDVRYPFNILQAVSLAISSFDRKLACE